MPAGNEKVHEQGEVQSSLSADAHRPGPGRVPRIQDHRLVDHGQLEVGGRIVHRNTAGLGDHDDEEPGEGEKVARMEGDTLLSSL